MNIDELEKKINRLSFKEKVNMKIAENENDLSTFNDYRKKIDLELKEIASLVDSELIDKLEKRGYGLWALRLSELSDEDDEQYRAKKFLKHKYSELRREAKRILRIPK